jgi:hypothetical protein
VITRFSYIIERAARELLWMDAKAYSWDRYWVVS